MELLPGGLAAEPQSLDAIELAAIMQSGIGIIQSLPRIGR